MKLIIIAIIASQLAQFSKVIIYYIKNKKWEWYRILHASGMPSAHSAAVVSVTSYLGFKLGIQNDLFGIAFVLASIVIYDATNVRYQAGLHAQVLNDIVDNDLMIKYQKNAGVKKPKGELKELIGHTIMEAVGGIFLGVVIGYLAFINFGG